MEDGRYKNSYISSHGLYLKLWSYIYYLSFHFLLKSWIATLTLAMTVMAETYD